MEKKCTKVFIAVLVMIMKIWKLKCLKVWERVRLLQMLRTGKHAAISLK